VNLVGGPEVIPKPEQVQACSDGIIDMAFAVCGEYRQVIPEVAALHLSPSTPWEARKNGIYDYWLNLHKKYNLYYLGRWSYDINYIFYLKKPIKNLAGFKGLKISPTGRTDKLIEALGAVNVEVGGSELYSAMEKGLVDGYVWSDSGLLSSWKEVTKCAVDQPILSAATFTTVMNLKKFNSLPKHLQDVLTTVAVEYEPVMAKYYDELRAKEQKGWKDAGVSFIKLPPEEAKWLNDSANKLAWEMVKTTMSPEAYGKLRKGMLME
jgi:TRAP-type C4-dicarboxylate transport system substrate-binding protein